MPGRIEYRYPLMFEQGEVRVLSYPLETVLAEKLETVVSRGVENTRGRDFCDIHVLLALKSDGIDVESLHEAVIATASRRGSLRKMAGCEVVLEEVKGSSIMRGSGPRTSPGRLTRLVSISKRRSILRCASRASPALTS